MTNPTNALQYYSLEANTELLREPVTHLNMHSCTCSSPPVVDLSHSSSAKQLKEHLQTWGWAHVVWTDHEEKSLLNTLKNVKNEARKLFENPLRLPSNIAYRGRAAESGSSTLQHVEPKQSLEVKRCCASTEQTILHQWCRALHSVAVRVNQLLEIPENVLLQEKNCTCSNLQSHCNIDLMRVFCYDTVTDRQLGSSPHTDWGSWTVVWQDNIGGLQAYCQTCKKYNDVKVPNKNYNNNPVRFVVHVGDVISLSIGNATIRNSTVSLTTDARVIFPSPQHRVVSPTDQERISLVYFSYPPPGMTLETIENSLAENAILPEDINSIDIDFSSYYILKNQTSGQGEGMTEVETYHSIRSTPLDKVFDTKWGQVQRD